jgi:hypothetical protein
MLTTLLASPEGVRLLSTEDEFLPQIRASFAQLDPVFVLPFWPYEYTIDLIFQFNGFTLSDPVLSKQRIAETLTYGYLEMLGTLSKHKEGIEYVPHLLFTLCPFLLTTLVWSYLQIIGEVQDLHRVLPPERAQE